MNEIIIAAILLSLLLIASIAIIWFIDKRINDVESSIRDLTIPGNGLDAEDTKESVWSVSWNTPPLVGFYPYAPADAQAVAPAQETLASEVAQSAESAESEKAPLEWEVGRTYKTRDGLPVKLVVCDKKNSHPCLFDDHMRRTARGCCVEGRRSRYDIIDYWDEPQMREAWKETKVPEWNPASELRGTKSYYGLTQQLVTPEPSAPEDAPSAQVVFQEKPLEWVIGREYITRNGKTVKLLAEFDAPDAPWPYIFSDGWTRSKEGLSPSCNDIISEAPPKRDMAGVAPVSLYEKRSKSTHWKRKNAGVCVRCGKAEPDGSKTTCAGCSKKRRIIARAKRAEEQERGHYAE